MRRHAFFILVCLMILAGPVQAQNETRLQGEFRREGESFKDNCLSFKSLGGCAELLFTGHPLHIAVGSLAPQNGFGFGPAFVTAWNPSENWRMSVNADAVATINGSWRAGVYWKSVFTKEQDIVVKKGRPRSTANAVAVHLYPVFDVYAQAISLNKISYFGLGPSTTPEDRSYFGMRETIVGTKVTYPIFKPTIFRPLKMSLQGEVNGRFVDIRGNHNQSSPSIEQLYTEATAPGLRRQPAFVQFGEGVRVQPSLFADNLRLNYLVNFQQFIAAGDSRYSFRRLTVDLAHQIPLSRKTKPFEQSDYNGPDDCSADVSADSKCPSYKGTSVKGTPPKPTYDRVGTIGLRLLLMESFTSGGNVVPFYFQPTLGGSDINGKPTLAAFQDYRFRAPNLLLLQGSIEHSLYGPFGVTFMAETGRVAFRRSDLEFKHMVHSYSAGLTLRAGGFPMVYLMFAWGSREGTHTIASMNTSLLGASSRPSLY